MRSLILAADICPTGTSWADVAFFAILMAGGCFVVCLLMR